MTCFKGAQSVTNCLSLLTRGVHDRTFSAVGDFVMFARFTQSSVPRERKLPKHEN